MSGLDTAAAAFDADMGSNTGSAPSEVGNDTSENAKLDISDVFPHMNTHEDDVEAGGDSERAPRRAKAKQPVEDDEDEDDLDAEALRQIKGEDGDEDEEGPDGVDDEDEDEEEDDDEDEDETLYDVIVDGEPAKVTLKEMQSGYIRQETFHRRLNKINEAEVVIQREAAALLQDRIKYSNLVDQIEEDIKALVPAEPNWDELFASDPAKARSLQKEYAALQTKLDGLKASRDAAREEARQLNTREQQKFIRAEKAKLASLFPSWSDPVKGQENMARDVKAMARTAKSVGFHDQEIENTHDSRMIAILHKAAAYDRIMARSNPKPVKRGKQPITTGAGRTRTAPKGLDKATTQLRRTGSVEDAAAVFQKML